MGQFAQRLYIAYYPGPDSDFVDKRQKPGRPAEGGRGLLSA